MYYFIEVETLDKVEINRKTTIRGGSSVYYKRGNGFIVRDETFRRINNELDWYTLIYHLPGFKPSAGEADSATIMPDDRFNCK